MNDSTQLDEAGRVINSTNLGLLKQMYQALKLIFASSGDTPDEEADTADKPVKQAKATANDAKGAKAVTDVSEAALSASDMAVRLTKALKAKYSYNSSYLYIRDVYPTYVVYQVGYDSDMLAVSYSVAENGTITVADNPEAVLSRTSYERLDGTPLEEAVTLEELTPCAELLSADLTEAAVPLQEAVRRRIKLISPGKGSSGYYPAATLQRDGPKVFTKGLKMFWDHQTEEEAAKQPEGSLDRLAAVLESNAQWEDDPKQGAGLYATAKVYEKYAPRLAELADDIGVSIRATGKARVDHVEGLGRTPVIEAITGAKSVDFVTTPGAGGKVLQLFEAAKHTQHTAAVSEGASTVTDQQDYQALQETVARQSEVLTMLTEQLRRRDAASIIDSELSTVQGLLPATRSRIASTLKAAALPLTEAGSLDEVKLKEAVAAAVTTEAQYLASMGVGSVRGMGASQPSGTVTAAELQKELAEAINDL